MKRCFELITDEHRKFWTVEVIAHHYLATYGRIGTKGQTQIKSFTRPYDAEDYAQKMIDQKLGKGYRHCASLDHPGAAADLLKALGIYNDEGALVSHLMRRAFDGHIQDDGK